jgi:sulfate permease, SulP family
VPRLKTTEGSLPKFGSAIRELRARGYTRTDFKSDAVAGVVVGLVALPLSMALAIAAGAPPEYGLFTAIVAGVVVALTGGSMHSVTGPTAAFVVLLVPVTARYGVEGLLVATAMAGVMMFLMGVFGLGRLIQFVPHPVTTGFTAGIAVVIAVLQLGDLMGLGRIEGERIAERVSNLVELLPGFSWPDLAVGVLTLLALIVWPRISRRVPGPLVGLVLATVAGLLLVRAGSPVATITTEFGGIPSGFPTPSLPWSNSGLGWEDVSALVPTAGAIALLGSIESLLCAVVADGMTGGRHDPDSELVGLGLGNMVAPFFGGFAATGAIARTATAIRAGGRTPVTVVVHSVFLLASMLILARVLGHIPMAGMAALLLVVAWNMADRHHFLRITRIAPRSDVLVMWVCFLLTVAFDMVVAVLVGVVLAALLFMRRMVEISGATLVGGAEGHTLTGLPPGVVFYDVAGPMFFGAAQKALDALSVVGDGVHTVIMDLEDVPAMDATGLVALESAVERLNQTGVKVVLSGVQPQPRRALEKAGFTDREGLLEITDNTGDTLDGFLLR